MGRRKKNGKKADKATNKINFIAALANLIAASHTSLREADWLGKGAQAPFPTPSYQKKGGVNDGGICFARRKHRAAPVCHHPGSTKEIAGLVAPFIRTHRKVRSFCNAKPLARPVVQKKATADNEDKKTPFAIIEVRSANCTNSKGRTFRWD